jgi:hypothetical protein
MDSTQAFAPVMHKGPEVEALVVDALALVDSEERPDPKQPAPGPASVSKERPENLRLGVLAPPAPGKERPEQEVDAVETEPFLEEPPQGEDPAVALAAFRPPFEKNTEICLLRVPLMICPATRQEQHPGLRAVGPRPVRNDGIEHVPASFVVGPNRGVEGPCLEESLVGAPLPVQERAQRAALLHPGPRLRIRCI